MAYPIDAADTAYTELTRLLLTLDKAALLASGADDLIRDNNLAADSNTSPAEVVNSARAAIEELRLSLSYEIGLRAAA